ncbi:MAG: cation:proton antiporter subunit C [Pseudomonadota bacterium]
MPDYVLSHYNYWVVIVLMMVGLYIVFESGNLIKRLVGLSIFQTSVFLLYISLGKVAGGTAPILIGGGHGGDKSHGGDESHGAEGAHAVEAVDAHAGGHGGAHDAAHGAEHAAEILYSNPLPHVLILTAIVVGVATLSVGLAISVRIREAYGSVENDEIRAADISLGEAEETAA